MKFIRCLVLFNLIGLCLGLTSCNRSKGEFFDDTRSAGRYMSRGVRSLGGKQGDSRQVQSREDFMCYAGDYIPFEDDDLSNDLSMTNTIIQQPDESPGDPGSSIPGIDRFKDPKSLGELAELFKRIHFPYNSSLVKGQENLQVVRAIANYLKTHGETYIFVEGHCDERGPEAYNLALGSRRSNAVRSLLVTEGVDPNNVFTISYGKERPLTEGHSEDAWNANRRAEFKIYKRG